MRLMCLEVFYPKNCYSKIGNIDKHKSIGLSAIFISCFLGNFVVKAIENTKITSNKKVNLLLVGRCRLG